MKHASATLPDQDLLRKLFSYDVDTGALRWKERDRADFPSLRSYRAWNSRYAGKSAGYVNSQGYVQVIIHKRSHLGHRLIWKLVYGNDPAGDIDHENGIRSDNRLRNLRDVSAQANNRNSKRPSHNVSGHIGVGFHLATGLWRARIVVGKKEHHLGLFASKTEAVAARLAAQRRLGFHPNHGRPA